MLGWTANHGNYVTVVRNFSPQFHFFFISTSVDLSNKWMSACRGLLSGEDCASPTFLIRTSLSMTTYTRVSTMRAQTSLSMKLKRKGFLERRPLREHV